MGQLRDRMYQDLKLRGYKHKTITEYLRWGRLYATHCRRSPEEMGEPEVRAFLMHLLEEKGARPASHEMAVADRLGLKKRVTPPRRWAIASLDRVEFELAVFDRDQAFVVDLYCPRPKQTGAVP